MNCEKMQTMRRSISNLWLAIAMTAIFVAQSPAQQPAPATGRIVGRIVTGAAGEGLVAASIQVLETNLGAISGEGGRFIINNVPVGRVTLRVSSIGFSTRTVTDLEVTAHGSTDAQIALDIEAVEIGAIEVSAARERGSLDRALDEQRAATAVVSAVTAEQIARSTDSDAAQAVQRVGGVTVQDGKFVVVRGLGERYTTTSLNGARIPSAEPEKKLVPLDLFPASLLDQITTSKTFTPDQPGDFSGAQVNLRTREFASGGHQSISVSAGYNAAVTGKSILAAPATTSDWLGFGSSARELPAQLDANSLIGSLRNVWSADRGNAVPNGSLSFATGAATSIGDDHVSYLLSGTYSAAQEARTEEMRAQAQSAGDSTVEIDRYEGTTSRASVLWGGVANASILSGAHSRIAFNNTYNRSADNEARFEVGTSENYGNLPLQITRLRYVERAIRSHQLLGEHEISDRQRIDWSLSASSVSRAEPDRSEIVYATDSDPATGAPLAPAWLATAGEGAVRTFGDLHESSWEVAAHSKRMLRALPESSIKFGVLGRYTDRTADNFAYSITAPLLPRADRQLSPESIFADHATRGDDIFRVAPLSQGGSYRANDRLVAGYGMLDWVVSPALRITAGARVERSVVEVDAEPTVGAAIKTNPAFTDLLPSITVNLQTAQTHHLRFSATQTLSRPEYRELAGIQYREVLGGDNVIGNPSLQRTLIRNLDARYEIYPGSGEAFSVALFAKFFRDPIERVYLGTSGTRVVTFMNADRASNYGVEIEARKNINAFTAFTNVTLMKSRITIGDQESGASRISDERAMVGQSPYVVNAGLTFAPEASSFNATVLYNVHGKRIVNAAEMPLPDVYEMPRHSIDVALRFPFIAGLSAKLDLKNVLDQPYEILQGETVRESYKTGRVFSLGVTWRR